MKLAPTSVSVNLLPFIGVPHSTHSFWKEILKQIMHSMGMSMIRERSIINFVERISRFNNKADAYRKNLNWHDKSVEKVLSGWLELRKGFHCYLTDDAILIIFKMNVLMEVLNTGKLLDYHKCLHIKFVNRWR